MRVVELCAGAGGMALGLEAAGFDTTALVENDPWCCSTLRAVPRWRKAVREVSVKEWRAVEYAGVDLLAGGIPCPPFSRAGENLAGADERDLFPDALRIVAECQPRAVFFENVKGLTTTHADYLDRLSFHLRLLGYDVHAAVLDAQAFGVPQRRERTMIVALPHNTPFEWPEPSEKRTTVGAALRREVGGDWHGADDWARKANKVAPTLVGGSKKHGGPDLGPTQARAAWLKMGVDGRALADARPGLSTQTPIRLTTRMCAILQGFPVGHPFQGGKTAQYRQIGNALPPALAEAVGRKLVESLA
jgi:DNA (cytosine-5)-methyltransferase 1